MRRSDFPVILLLLPLLLLAPALARAARAPETEPRKILVLNSYHKSYTWTDREFEGVIKALQKAELNTETYLEYMDCKRFPKNEHFEQLAALYKLKYTKNRPELIITLDNPAFEFAIRYRRSLFKNIPVVFAGLNDYDPSLLMGERNLTGVVELQDMLGTVKAAMALHPGLQEVVVLHDYTASGLASRHEAEEQFASLRGVLRIRYLPDMKIEEVVTTIKALKPGSILLPFSYSRDISGRIFTHSELTRILSENTTVPVYGTKEERLDHGIIGGSLLEGVSHGALAGGLAARILNGESAESLPVITEPQSRLMFDYKILRRFNIDPDKLPAGSELINNPPGFYKQHAFVINLSAGIIALISTSFILILLSNRKRIHAEEALVESERGKTRVLEAANQEMEAFCYAVSHDLQAPLRHIHSFSRILEEEHAEALDDDGVHCLVRLKSASMRMTELVKDLLTLSQISKKDFSCVRFDFGKLAEEIFSELEVESPARKAEFTVDPEMYVFADRNMVRILLANLIGNAWKYTSKREMTHIHVGKQSLDRQTVYFVRDNGAGFDMRYKEKLFAPFQRLHSDDEFEGSGIGLATVQRVVNRHGGKIWAESKPDEGALFCFTLEP